MTVTSISINIHINTTQIIKNFTENNRKTSKAPTKTDDTRSIFPTFFFPPYNIQNIRSYTSIIFMYPRRRKGKKGPVFIFIVRAFIFPLFPREGSPSAFRPGIFPVFPTPYNSTDIHRSHPLYACVYVYICIFVCVCAVSRIVPGRVIEYCMFPRIGRE